MAGLIKEEHKSDLQKEIDKRIKEKIFNMLWSRVKAQAKPDDGWHHHERCRSRRKRRAERRTEKIRLKDFIIHNNTKTKRSSKKRYWICHKFDGFKINCPFI